MIRAPMNAADLTSLIVNAFHTLMSALMAPDMRVISTGIKAAWSSSFLFVGNRPFIQVLALPRCN